MRFIIAGSRNIKDYNLVSQILRDHEEDITEIVSGMAKGVDELGLLFGKANHIPVSQYPADWNLYGKKAGILRNIEMAKNADALIAIWDGVSRGTRHMIEEATNRGLKVYVYEVA
jgi:hypothetical protein